ncbi:MAG: hypothetical protein RXR51_04530 [Nitrososphaeria archaeon]
MDYPDLLIMAFLLIAALALCSMLLVEAQQSKVSSAFHMQSLLLNSLDERWPSLGHCGFPRSRSAWLSGQFMAVKIECRRL